MKQLIVGLIAEGNTDIRFLRSVVERSFQDILLNECEQDIEFYLHLIRIDKTGLDFPQMVVTASRAGVEECGIMSLAVHTDADRETYEQRWNDKIVPAHNALNAEKSDSYCLLLTPIIPVRMIEAWLLADKELFKAEIGTELMDSELGIDRDPEGIANPKAVIEEAIRKATEMLPKRRRRISISDLYGYIGDAVSINSLSSLSSYRRFRDVIRQTLRALHYMY